MSRTVCIIARDADAALRYAEAVAHGFLGNVYPSRAAAEEALEKYPSYLGKKYSVHEFQVDRTPGKVTITAVR